MIRRSCPISIETQGYALTRLPDSYSTDGMSSLKLAYGDLGEIDFIACASITDEPALDRDVCGQTVQMETPAEIVAKKVYYRGRSLQPRDMFDLAAVERALGEAYTLEALMQCGSDRCQSALETVERARPEFVAGVIAQLMYRDDKADLIGSAQDTTRRLLQQALA